MMFLLGVSYLILSSYHTAWLLLGSTVNTLRSGISISENPQNANFAKTEFYEVRALACNVIPDRSYEARIHLPRTPVNKGMKKKRRKGRDIVAQTPASTKRHRAGLWKL
jgi:hypothetical protein